MRAAEATQPRIQFETNRLHSGKGLEIVLFGIDTDSNCDNERAIGMAAPFAAVAERGKREIVSTNRNQSIKAALKRDKYGEGSRANRIEVLPGVSMSVSQAIASHIPYLRRFSRALTGNQSGGDAYVLATLESIVADPSGFDAAKDVRASLYRAFLQVWRSMPVNEHTEQVELSSDEHGARRNLEAISLRPRIAFLLSSLEGFDTAEVSRVLDCTPAEAAGLIDAAGKEIANQIRTDVLIIEDEPFIALDLQTLVEELGHRVVNVARTHTEAVDAVGKERPGLILADIQLADGSSGLEAVNQILDTFSVPVIFITAYPERFLTGAPPEPAFLITKPFGVDSLKAVISQALFFDRRSHRKEESAVG